MHYQISVYLVRLTLIEVVKEPGVGVDEELTLRSHPGNFGATGAGGVLCILCHTVAEDGYQVRVLTDVSVFASQDTHESTKTTLAINEKYIPIACASKAFPPAHDHNARRGERPLP